ncbi:UbiA-like polyprenyltransferase [Chengkuizengella sp. SCS-71B]|uniref:UbiA-like polyprenyltransferase n=1 Tax=Chengkuizengella sp. SCS-71B TaxID=3115290 RepID=UPI0032C2309A
MLKKTKIFLEMIKFEHTIFALPFAFMGAVLGSYTMNGHLPSWAQIGWIILAMIGARSAAMGLNRLIDKVIDGKNPRTAARAIPAGLLSSKEVILFIVVSFALLFFASAKLDPIAVKLLPIAVFFLVFYSYTKRFTWACHLILGFTIALAPLGGWVAITGEINTTAIILFVSVALWTAGFDIIYACQDIEFDRKEGLYSIPSSFGIANALKIAKFLHFITAIGLVSIMFLANLSWWYLVGTLIAALLLIYEHQLVKPNDLSKLNAAFFTMNGVLSVVVFVFTLIDLVVYQ